MKVIYFTAASSSIGSVKNTMPCMTDLYEQDRQWLIDNGLSTINPDEFSDRVSRDMEQNNTYNCIEVVRNQVVTQMLLEQ